MKWIRKCPVFFLLTVSGLLFSATGLAGIFTVYGEYGLQPVKQPFLVLMMEGIEKGVMPWEAWGGLSAAGSEVTAASAEPEEAGQNIEDIEADAAGAAGEEGAGEALSSPAAGTEYAAAEAGTAGNGAENVDSGAEPGASAGNPGTAGEEAAEEEEPVTYEFQEVTEDYFNDAVFIGDSRTVGLFEYGGLEERADFFAKISLTIYDVFTATVGKDEETGEKITVEDALAKKQYGKVYLMLGINELGTGNTEYFMEHYAEAVEKIREMQPDAIIFVEGIMRVTGEKSENDPIFNNARINEKNAAIAALADNRDIFYIDVNEAVCDENGDLYSDYTIDDIHLKAKYYSLWKDFLLKHGIIKD